MDRLRLHSPPSRVLIVDDDDDAAWSLARALHLQLHCEVRTATDGAEALDQATDMRPEAVIMDIHMPGVNGMEAARFMRQLFAPTDLPLLVALTGLDSEADRQLIRECGFHAHLVKPVDFDKLYALLSHPPSVRPPAGPA